jgi:hypothetical protein
VLAAGAIAIIELGSGLYHGDGGYFGGGCSYGHTPTAITLTGPMTAAAVLLAVGDGVRRDCHRNKFMADFIEHELEAEAVPEYARYKVRGGHDWNARSPGPPLSFDPIPDPTIGLSTADVVALVTLGPEDYLAGRPLVRGADDGHLLDTGATMFEGLVHKHDNVYEAEFSGPFA